MNTNNTRVSEVPQNSENKSGFSKKWSPLVIRIFVEKSDNTRYKITPSYSAVIPNIPITMIKHNVFLHLATKHAQTAKKWGKIAFPSTDVKFATVYHCSCKKHNKRKG